MSRVSANIWGQLTDAYEQADAEAELALQARDRTPIPANDELPSGLPETHDALAAVRDLWADKLLQVEVAGVAAAAYQLRLYAYLHHGCDLTAPGPDDECAQTRALRRIHSSLGRIARG